MTRQELKIFLPDAAATHQFGVTLGQILPPGSILLLQGDLGSGKTSLVQGIGEGLSIPDPIVSPTFVLLNEYPEGRIPLYHFDLYRLSPSEVDALHLEIYWEGWEYPVGIVAIEWAERLSYKPVTYLEICLTLLEASGGRQATLTPFGEVPAALLNSLHTSIAKQ